MNEKPKYQFPANSSIIKEFSRCIFLNVFVFSTSFAVKTTTKIEKVFFIFLVVGFYFLKKKDELVVLFFLPSGAFPAGVSRARDPAEWGRIF